MFICMYAPRKFIFKSKNLKCWLPVSICNRNLKHFWHFLVGRHLNWSLINVNEIYVKLCESGVRPKTTHFALEMSANLVISEYKLWVAFIPYGLLLHSLRWSSSLTFRLHTRIYNYSYRICLLFCCCTNSLATSVVSSFFSNCKLNNLKVHSLKGSLWMAIKIQLRSYLKWY